MVLFNNRSILRAPSRPRDVSDHVHVTVDTIEHRDVIIADLEYTGFDSIAIHHGANGYTVQGWRYHSFDDAGKASQYVLNPDPVFMQGR